MKKDTNEVLQECKNKLWAIIYAKEKMEEEELIKTLYITVIKKFCSIFEIYTFAVWDEDPNLTPPYDDKTAGDILTMYFLINKEFANKTMLSYLQVKDKDAFTKKLSSLKRVKTFKDDPSYDFGDVTCSKGFLSFHHNLLRDNSMNLIIKLYENYDKKMSKEETTKKTAAFRKANEE